MNQHEWRSIATRRLLDLSSSNMPNTDIYWSIINDRIKDELIVYKDSKELVLMFQKFYELRIARRIEEYLYFDAHQVERQKLPNTSAFKQDLLVSIRSILLQSQYQDANAIKSAIKAKIIEIIGNFWGEFDNMTHAFLESFNPFEGIYPFLLSLATDLPSRWGLDYKANFDLSKCTQWKGDLEVEMEATKRGIELAIRLSDPCKWCRVLNAHRELEDEMGVTKEGVEIALRPINPFWNTEYLRSFFDITHLYCGDIFWWMTEANRERFKPYLL